MLTTHDRLQQNKGNGCVICLSLPFSCRIDADYSSVSRIDIMILYRRLGVKKFQLSRIYWSEINNNDYNKSDHFLSNHEPVQLSLEASLAQMVRALAKRNNPDAFAVRSTRAAATFGRSWVSSYHNAGRGRISE